MTLDSSHLYAGLIRKLYKQTFILSKLGNTYDFYSGGNPVQISVGHIILAEV
jgi:hypothetical protein